MLLEVLAENSNTASLDDDLFALLGNGFHLLRPTLFIPSFSICGGQVCS